MKKLLKRGKRKMNQQYKDLPLSDLVNDRERLLLVRTQCMKDLLYKDA